MTASLVSSSLSKNIPSIPLAAFLSIRQDRAAPTLFLILHVVGIKSRRVRKDQSLWNLIGILQVGELEGRKADRLCMLLTSNPLPYRAIDFNPSISIHSAWGGGPSMWNRGGKQISNVTKLAKAWRRNRGAASPVRFLPSPRIQTRKRATHAKHSNGRSDSLQTRRASL
eukprot:766940-Hanusia_phi.AAC.5